MTANTFAHIVYVEEYSRGWGSRVDDILYFKNVESAYKYVKDFNSSNTDSKVPDWYMFAAYKSNGPLPPNKKFHE